MKLKNKQSGKIYDSDQITFVIYGGEYGEVEETYLSLDELNQDWEEVKPKEPLIKDEKIRKAVRAWAEANEISQAQFDRYTSGFSASDDGHNLLSMISFDGFVFMFVDGKYYTIDELCGEEEE